MSSNPYSSPPAFEPAIPTARSAQVSTSLPVFCLVIFILDLGFCAIRLLMVVFGAIGLALAAQDPMVARTGLFEVLAGAGIVAFGVPANIAMLLKQRWGVSLAYVKMAATLGSIAVGVWQFTFIVDQFAPGSAELVVAFVAAAIAFLLRLILLGLYLAAVMRFSAWLKQRAETLRPPSRDEFVYKS